MKAEVSEAQVEAPNETPKGAARGRRTSRRANATRATLVQAAAKLFAENGYHATSVPDIVKAAGVGHGTFYEYFGSRREILVALAEEAYATTSKLPQLTGKDLIERVHVEIRWYLQASVENLVLWKIWRDASRFDTDIAATLRHARSAQVERVRKGIEAFGARPGIDPRAAAVALIAMLEEFVQRWFIDGDGPGTSQADIVAASETVSNIYLAAILGYAP
jgi:AcrR family transcriptional regulator